MWNDLNANKSIDTGEAGLAGWKVFIDTNDDGLWEKSEAFVLTDANGYFVFNTLAPGTYSIVLQSTKHWTATSRTTQTVRLTAGQVWSKLGFGQRQ